MGVVADGGVGTGVNPFGRDFPFVAPSADVAGLLCDFWLSHRVDGLTLPLAVTRLAGVTQPPGSSSSLPAGQPAVVVKDAAGVVVFDGADAEYEGRAFSTRFYVHEWRTASAVCLAVQHTGQADPDRVVEYPAVVEPVSGVLDARCYERAPAGVTAVVVNGARLTGRVHLVNGYNTTLAAGAGAGPTAGLVRRTSLRPEARVALAADPGTGAGVYPGCESDPVPAVRRVGGATPDAAGNLTVAADGCYWVRRPAAGWAGGSSAVSLTPAAVTLGNDCRPCCECDDYVAVYRAAARVHGRYRDLGRLAEAVRARFAENKARWLDQKACREARRLRVTLVSAAPGGVIVLAAVCNPSKDCVRVAVVVSARGNGGAPAVVPGSTFVTDPGTGEWKSTAVTGTSTVQFPWVTVDPTRSVRVRAGFAYGDDPGCTWYAGVVVDAYEYGVDGPVDTVDKTVALVCAAGAMNVA